MSRQQKTDRRLWWLLAVAGWVSVLWLGVTVALLTASLGREASQQVGALLGERLWWLAGMWLLGMGGIAYGLQRWFRHWVTPSVQLAEQARVLLQTDVVRDLDTQGSSETRVLAQLFNRLVEQRESLRRDMDEKVQQAAQRIALEKSRLAALMSELTQSVVVCNLEGRILLYNQRARAQFRDLSRAPQLADGAELVGLGRSIHTVLDRDLLSHALQNLKQRMQRSGTQASVQFVTVTASGQLLRVQMAPVRAQTPAPDNPDAALDGYVLMLDNITSEFQAEAERDQLLLNLTEGSRAALANVQAALDMLDYPDLDAHMRERFLGVVRDEVQAMSARVRHLSNTHMLQARTRWPLENMAADDLLRAVKTRIENTMGMRVETESGSGGPWLKVESFSLIQALLYLSARLREEFEVKFVVLRASPSTATAQKVQLDLLWQGPAISTETVMGWELDGMALGAGNPSLTVREVVERHAGAFWFERDRAQHQAFFRFLLPAAEADVAVLPPARTPHDRPEFYDFDLFQTSAQTRAWEDTPLIELAYTVFDTETTGLQPAQGDEIIQIGATRIVNGKLLRQECFDQLVNPGRLIPDAGVAIHGITQDMVAGQPDIRSVLPAFHAFAQDTVLVAHNAAFDMRFLQLKEVETGVVFQQPVLDTLLLSAVVHPQQDSHRLEAIAERFNVQVHGRHTAMGDAMVTAEVFLRLIPLLAGQGIHTLGQARTAAQLTYFARLKY